MENGIKIQQMVDGVIDLRKNASDVSRNVMEQCLRHECLCVGFSLIFYNPDDTYPAEEKWSHAAYIPSSSTIPDEFKLKAKSAMDYIAQGVKDIWNETFKKPDKIH